MDSNYEVKTWDEFRDTGLLWFINSILRVFGWAISVTTDEGKVVSAAPARVKYRGFSESSNTRGYEKITAYLKDNIYELVSDIADDKENMDETIEKG